jgi:hypothetical protein
VRGRSVTAALLLGAAVASPLRAQRTINDTDVIDHVGAVMMETAAWMLLRAARDTASIALSVSLPPEATASGWLAVRDYLTRVLRARPLQSTDERDHLITLKSVLIEGDTVRAFLEVGIRRRCRDGWIGDGDSHMITWTLHGPRKSIWYRHRDQLIQDDSICVAGQ